MAILLTGSKGFLGHNVARALELRKLEWRPLNVRLHQIGSSDLESIDTVIHCAAQIPMNDVPNESFRHTNIGGTNHLLEQCQKYAVKRFIYVSSMGVKFHSPYASSKLAPEESVKKSNMDYLILRPAHLYGPNEHMRLTFDLLRKRKFKFIIGLGNNLVSIAYVKDCAQSLVEAALSSMTDQTFNIVEPERQEVLYLRILRKAIEAKFVLVPVPKFLAIKRLGMERVAEIVAGYRIPGIADWKYVPTPLDIGLKDTYDIIQSRAQF